MSHKILIADAEPLTIDVLTAALEQAGYQVITATDGEQALERDGAHQPDLVCVDIHMPGLGGLDVCRALKATRSVPVLLTAAYLDDATSQGFATAGADDLLFKPFSPEEMIDKVAWYLSPED
jgi:CheY-like chemotaxis protein